MKKHGFLFLLILALACTAGALAAGNASVTQETLFVIPNEKGAVVAVLFGEITNTGDSPVVIGHAEFAFLNPMGEAIGGGRHYGFCPEIVGAGEKAFFAISHPIELAAGDTNIERHSVALVEKPATKGNLLLQATCDYNTYVSYDPATCSTDESNEPEGVLVTNLYATIENQTDTIAANPTVVWAVYDTDGMLIYVCTERADGVGLFPGSKIQLSTRIDPGIQVFLSASERQIGEVTATAWYK